MNHGKRGKRGRLWIQRWLRVKLYRKGKVFQYDLTKGKNLKVVLQKRDVIEVTDAFLKAIMPPRTKKEGDKPE